MLAEVTRQADGLDVLVSGMQVGHAGIALISAAIVDEEQLILQPMQSISQLFVERLQVIRLIEYRHDD
jgi:hypothetical protein